VHTKFRVDVLEVFSNGGGRSDEDLRDLRIRLAFCHPFEYLLLARSEQHDLRRSRRLLANEELLANSINDESVRAPRVYERVAAACEPIGDRLWKRRPGSREVFRKEAARKWRCVIEMPGRVEEDNTLIVRAGVESG
jgi:hypothetical protein